MSARTFAVSLLHGTIQAPPRVNISLPVLQAMEQMHGLQTYLTTFVDGVLYMRDIMFHDLICLKQAGTRHGWPSAEAS